ncbi:hypothetical protein BKI52_06705 [marine bacterium AO1-C]|nr:hypothetical protein BKI52_06705 [marine bacterium AO1-C]
MEEPLKAIVVDDEQYARSVIRHLLREEQHIQLVTECNNGFDAIEQIKIHQPQLVFLDVQMPEIDGFEVIAQTRHAWVPFYIFTTAYDQYALKAFEVNAIDYLLKPFSDARFFQAVKKAKEQTYHQQLQKLAALVQHVNPSNQQYLQRISIKSAGRIYFLQTDEIQWIEAADQYVEIHTAEKTHLLRETMNHLEQALNPQRFFRTHRSFIVNIDCVQEIKAHKNDYLVLLKDHTSLKLTRKRKEALQTLLN